MSKKINKTICLETITDLTNKIKYGRKGTRYILIEDGCIPSYSELQKQIYWLDRIAQLQRHLGLKVKPAIVFEKV